MNQDILFFRGANKVSHSINELCTQKHLFYLFCTFDMKYQAPPSRDCSAVPSKGVVEVTTQISIIVKLSMVQSK